MTDNDKIITAYLLTGNNGEDLMSTLLEHLSKDFKAQLLKEAQELVEQGADSWLQVYEECAGTNDDVVWN